MAKHMKKILKLNDSVVAFKNIDVLNLGRPSMVYKTNVESFLMFTHKGKYTCLAIESRLEDENIEEAIRRKIADTKELMEKDFRFKSETLFSSFEREGDIEFILQSYKGFPKTEFSFNGYKAINSDIFAWMRISSDTFDSLEELKSIGFQIMHDMTIKES